MNAADLAALSLKAGPSNSTGQAQRRGGIYGFTIKNTLAAENLVFGLLPERWYGHGQVPAKTIGQGEVK